MLNHISRIGLASTWIAAVVVLGACSVFLGFTLNAATGVLWLVAGLIPPAVMLLVWPSAPPVTIAELLHSVDNGVKPAKR